MNERALRLVLTASLLAACGENQSVVGGVFDGGGDASAGLDASSETDAPGPDVVDAPGPDVVDAPGPDVVDAPPADAPQGCPSDEACPDPSAPVCDLASGRCVRCTTANDRCPTGSYCVGLDQCAPGCRGDQDCAQSAGDGGATSLRCDVGTRRCVECVTDAHCPAGNLCVGNLCVAGCNEGQMCPAGQSCCGGGCVNPQENTAHCGGCGMTCAVANGAAACLNGTCSVGMCTAPYADCDAMAANGCETDTQRDVSHCGGCGMACASRPNSGASCAAGRCEYACAPGFADCDGDPSNGCEVDIRDSVAHCGACGRRCDPANATAACVMGACAVGSCNAGFGDCDGNVTNGCETDTRSSVAHCGGCGTACASRPNSLAGCASGACVLACLAGFADCDADPMNGCEVDTRTSVLNCGSCGRACRLENAASACAGGACRVASCAQGYGDCDADPVNGCEVDLGRSALHCGACGMACPARANATPSCTGGRCGFTCNAGFADCDGDAMNGCEVDTRTSVANCGACGSACASGVCAGGACQAPRCDDRVRNGGETDVDCGGGGCPACARCLSCAADRDCADGACGAQGRCTVRRDVSINWLTNCRGPGGGNTPVTVPGLPAGTYEVTPLRSGGTVWNPVTYPTNGWFWNLTCDNLAAPTLSTSGMLYPTADAAFAAVSGRSERVPFAGGDLVCAFADNPCSDNQGGVSFRIERVCP
ncbi:MAG: hypothetical protein R3A48_24090 [Polyangiales bacterium]